MFFEDPFFAVYSIVEEEVFPITEYGFSIGIELRLLDTDFRADTIHLLLNDGASCLRSFHRGDIEKEEEAS